jgi:anti-sigma B factor antagonist
VRTASDDIEVFELHGELDVTSAGALKEQLIEAIGDGRRTLLVDLTDAQFVDSATIGALIGGATRAHACGGTLAIVCSDPVILETFEIAALEQVIPIYPSRAAAVAELESRVRAGGEGARRSTSGAG